jgi:hypothetical protein
MQKPQFIKIIIPAGKEDLSPSVKRFFNKTRGLLLEVEFSNVRRRKIFYYEAQEVEPRNLFTPSTNETTHDVKFVLVKKDSFIK